MTTNLVIVESPAKAKTIEKYLGKGYKVKATLGHVRDLPKSKLGVDVKKDFTPQYITLKGKSKVLSELKKAIPKKGVVFLALDHDREGEAIAWHTAQAIDLIDSDGTIKSAKTKVNLKRIVFNEITDNAIKEAIENPRDINMDLVNSQQARRILDRLVGYTLSPLLWKKIRYGLSAGRVQSVAVRLVVERERARDAFKPEEFWDVLAFLLDDDKEEIKFKMIKRSGKKYVPTNRDQANEVKVEVEKDRWMVNEVTEREMKKYPKPPFTTSTMQQFANNRLGYSAKRTMNLAQQLYQGVKLKGKGLVALITYMRTDSTYMSTQAVNGMRGYVESNLGKDFLPDKPIFYKTKTKGAQEAHEAIRPTDFSLPPAAVKGLFSDDLYRLYDLVWRRAISSQMRPAVVDKMTIDVKAGKYIFRATAQKVKFEGFFKVWGHPKKAEDEDAVINIPLEKGQELKLKKIDLQQHFTKPPARYTDATLVKDLEKYGIGRPSTYAPIISTIQNRGYVSKDGRYFYPEDIGYIVNDLLMKHFEDVMDYGFTADMEQSLDDISDGKVDWVKLLKDFYFPFEKQVVKKEGEIKKEDLVQLGESDEKCPECNKKMVIKLGRYGRFLSCPDFPACKGMKSLTPEEDDSFDEKKYEIPKKCPECGGDVILKTGKYGKFWACSKYPDCKGTIPLLLKEKCPKCKGNLVERKGKWGKTFIGCSNYPKCKYIKKKSKRKESND